MMSGKERKESPPVGEAGTSAGWKAHASTSPRLEAVLLEIGGRVGNLTADLEVIAEHFQNRPADPLFGRMLRARLDAASARRGAALVEGRIEFANFPPALAPSEIQWDENPFRDPNWQWNLHNFALLRGLVAAHSRSGNSRELALAEKLVRGWIGLNFDQTPRSPLAWSDHATALRLENLLYFLEYARPGRMSRYCLAELLATICAHARILMDPVFYSVHTNHGLDQSYILYLTGAVLPEFVEAAAWRRVGRERTVDEVRYAFTEEGVHVENSPSYHFMFLNRAVMIQSLMEHFDPGEPDPLPGKLIDQAFAFAARLIKPDGTLPLVGDTQCTTAESLKLATPAAPQVGHEEYLYVLSGGKCGTKPEGWCRVYPRSGYAILRSDWEPADLASAFHLVFKAGFLSTYHRHDDDLSLVMSCHGEDWIIDAGLYSHDENDPFRRYVRSVKAHNSIEVDQLRPGRTAGEIGGSSLETILDSGRRQHFRGTHSLYPGFVVCRELIYEHPHSLLLTDTIRAEDQGTHQFCLRFHFPADKRVQLHSNGCEIRSCRNTWILNINVVEGEFDRIEVILGQDSPEIQGWTSPKYRQKEPAFCLCLHASGPAWRSRLQFSFSSG